MTSFARCLNPLQTADCAPYRADATIAAQATGAMSWAFMTALRKNPQQSYVQLLNSIRDELARKYTQRPQLSCSHPLSKLLSPHGHVSRLTTEWLYLLFTFLPNADPPEQTQTFSSSCKGDWAIRRQRHAARYASCIYPTDRNPSQKEWDTDDDSSLNVRAWYTVELITIYIMRLI